MVSRPSRSSPSRSRHKPLAARLSLMGVHLAASIWLHQHLFGPAPTGAMARAEQGWARHLLTGLCGYEFVALTFKFWPSISTLVWRITTPVPEESLIP